MSRRDKSPEDRQDRLILDLLDSRSSDQILGEESRSALRREYIEVLGLLPRALDEVSPPPRVKEQILETVERGGPETASPSVGANVTTFDEQRKRRGSGWPTWLVPLAASITVAMTAVAGWLVMEVHDQRVRVAELSKDLASARSITSAPATSQGALAELESRLALVTAPGTEFCALRPPEGSPATGAHGMAVMHPASEELFLRIEGLDPSPEGRRYTVWFAAEAGVVPGPNFAVEADEPVELSVSGRPAHIDAVMITLEADPTPKAPSMEPLLFGDERMRLL